MSGSPIEKIGSAQLTDLDDGIDSERAKITTGGDVIVGRVMQANEVQFISDSDIL